MPNAINWFEIPVTDFGRAKKFYGEIFEVEMYEQMMGPSQMGSSPVKVSVEPSLNQRDTFLQRTARSSIFPRAMTLRM
ncbi:MAG: hypothetical protein SGI89_05160 [bacterium]|nr:hypothetical protein [bacterium]